MRVLLDCDPGIDDTFALIYLAAAHHAGELELDCVTTTAGNVEAVQCAQNAAWILAQCNLPAIPLAAGEAQPLELALTTTPETHGEHGLGYAHAPERHVASDWDLLWCDAIERGTDDLHLIVTGPLTNLATFARRHPRHFAQLRHITVMGGAVNYPGNTTPTAEWNFWVDPHAAAEVFARTPVPITLCSLGVTEQFVLDPPRLDALVRALGDTPVAAALPVPQELLDAAEAEYAQMCADAKAKGARRKPPRPAPPTAAVLYEPAEDIVGQLRECLVEADGEDVIRLVTGNPLHRESIKAEINAVASAGLEFQVVPGMSLPSTVPSFAGIALGSTYTEADVTDGADWDALANATQPIVLQATKEDLPVISDELQQRGMPAETEAFVTVHGTTRLQRTHETTLGTLGKLDAELPGELVVTLGRSFDDRSKYSWWENRSLYGWRVLVPRTKEQAAAMSARLAGHGAIPQSVPTISVEPPRNPCLLYTSPSPRD